MDRHIYIGARVRVSRNQRRLGGAKYPGRTGVVVRENSIGMGEKGGLWYVDLDACGRAKARSEEMFYGTELELIEQEDTTMTQTTELQPGTVAELPLKLVDYDPDQPRKDVPEDYIEELADSIKAAGVKQPITVRPNPDKDGRYLVVYGECRTRASRQAKKKTIPAILAGDDDNNDLDRLLDQVRENYHRRDLNPMELAEVLHRLHKDFGCKSNKAIEDTLAQHGIKKMSRSYVANTRRLLDLPEWAQKEIREGRMTAAHGKHLLPATVSEAVTERVKTSLDAREEMPSVRELQSMVFLAFRSHFRALTDFQTHFDHAVECKGCQKMRKVSGGAGHAETFCLDPDCYAEKNTAAAAQTPAASGGAGAARMTFGGDEEPAREGPTEVEVDEDGHADLKDGQLRMQFDYELLDLPFRRAFDPAEAGCQDCEHQHPIKTHGDGSRSACFNVPCYRELDRAARADAERQRFLRSALTGYVRDRLLEEVVPEEETLQADLVAWLALGRPEGYEGLFGGEEEVVIEEWDMSGYDELQTTLSKTRLVDLQSTLSQGGPNIPEIAMLAVQVLKEDDLFLVARHVGMTADEYRVDQAWCDARSKDDLIAALVEVGIYDETDRPHLEAQDKAGLTARVLEGAEAIGVPDDIRQAWERLFSRETEAEGLAA